jgi:hypothetical protein
VLGRRRFQRDAKKSPGKFWWVWTSTSFEAEHGEKAQRHGNGRPVPEGTSGQEEIGPAQRGSFGGVTSSGIKMSAVASWFRPKNSLAMAVSTGAMLEPT